MSLPVRPPVRPWSTDPVPWMTGTGASAFDRWSIEELGVPQAVLMERAGTAAAQLVSLLYPTGRIGVLVGKGNNGSDALVVARTLAAWGREVRVVSARRLGSDHRLEGAELLHGWEIPTQSTQGLGDAEVARALEEADVWVDGLLGTGITGPPRDEPARLIAALRRRGGPVVALDVPSGVDADTGRVAGVAVAADVTVAFGFPKLGSLLHPGRARVGRLLVVEIGFPPLRPGDAGGGLLTPGWARSRWPRREAVTHKNRVGALAVVAGRPGMAGAAILAARTALRAGAGYVRLITHPGNRGVVQSALPESVFVDASDPASVQAALDASRAVAVGPGMDTGREARQLLDRILSVDLPRVVDADALTVLAESGGSERLGGDSVITPHPGEAARLLGGSVEEIQGDRVGAVQRLWERTGCGAAVLKGTPTLVQSADGLWIDTVGTSDLAVAGMGDTLTGAVGSFLAQGIGAADAAGLGLIATGRAAVLADRGPGLQSADVPEFVPEVLAEGEATSPLPIPGLTLDLDRAR